MDDFSFPVTFTEWVKRRRKLLDLTQDELALRAGCSVFALRKIESGERRPSKQLARLLSQALQIPADEQQIFIQVARSERNLERLKHPTSLVPGSVLKIPIAPPAPRPLPLQATPVVGRAAEMAALKRIFDDPQCRLLTLTGLGGIGKTRLAVEFAASQQVMFPSGIYYVPLASLNSPDLIVPAIAEALGLAFSGPTGVKEQLLNYLAGRPGQATLLVLDNLEHLLSPPLEGAVKTDAASLVMELLDRLLDVKILATSRERLNLRGEWMYELHGLPVPPPGFSDELESFGAISLFEMCARRASRGFSIQPEDRPALIRICRLLEGIPLAIELAAGWVSMLSCQEIATEIETGLDLLSTTMRDVPARHRSIRATFDHSWKLLSPDECRILQRLSIFHGGFSRSAAEQISGANLPVLASLYDKSLILHTGEGRYDLHEVVRQYALAYFDGDPQNRQIRERHCEYYLSLIHDREKILKSAGQQEAVRELITEIDNLRAAWFWAIQKEMYEWIGPAIRGLGWFCEVAGLLQEGIDQLEPVILALRPRKDKEEYARILGQALAQQGLLYFRKGQFDRAMTALDESLLDLRPIGDPALLTDPLIYIAIITHLTGDIDGARVFLAEGLACARAAQDRWFEAYALYNQGYLDSLTGKYETGYQQMLAGLAMWRAIGDPSSIALGLNFISPTAILLGYIGEAQVFLQESLSLCVQVGDRWAMGTAYRNLGMTELSRGNAAEAMLLLEISLDIFGGYTVGWDIARSLVLLGDALRMKGERGEAKKKYQDACRIALDAKSIPISLDTLLGFAHLQFQAGEFERSLSLAYFVSCHPASIQGTKDACKTLIREIEKRIDKDRIQAIKEASAEKSLEAMVTMLQS